MNGERGSGSWKIALADMMTVLMAFFLVMWIGSIIPDDQRKRFINAMFDEQPVGDAEGKSLIPKNKGLMPYKERKTLIFTQESLLQTLRELSDRDSNIEIVKTQDGVLIRLKNDILFESGRAIPRRDALNTVNKIGVILSQSRWPLKIIGHTDDVPINTIQFPSNWELSSARASTVARILEKSRVAHERILVIGAADTMPLVENDSPALRAINRRVEIIVLTGEEERGHWKRFPYDQDRSAPAINTTESASLE